MPSRCTAKEAAGFCLFVDRNKSSSFSLATPSPEIEMSKRGERKRPNIRKRGDIWDEMALTVSTACSSQVVKIP